MFWLVKTVELLWKTSFFFFLSLDSWWKTRFILPCSAVTFPTYRYGDMFTKTYKVSRHHSDLIQVKITHLGHVTTSDHDLSIFLVYHLWLHSTFCFYGLSVSHETDSNFPIQMSMWFICWNHHLWRKMFHAFLFDSTFFLSYPLRIPATTCTRPPSSYENSLMVDGLALFRCFIIHTKITYCEYERVTVVCKVKARVYIRITYCGYETVTVLC